jgi:hypothetical protein
MNLADYERNFAAAREQYHEIMTASDDAAALMRWMVENDVNPYGVFHESAFASLASTLEGFIGLHNSVSHALYDDGDIAFVNTAGQGPKIVFYCQYEGNFEELFMKDVDKNLKKSYIITGFLKDVHEFIQVYQEHEQRCREIFERIEKARSGRKS